MDVPTPAIYRDAESASGWTGGDSPLIETQVSIYNCPSRSNRVATLSGGTRISLGDYAGCVGPWVNDWWMEWSNRKDPHPREQELVWTGIIVKGGHVNVSPRRPRIFKYREVGFQGITDGSSNTILVAEKAAFQGAWSPTNSDGSYNWELMGYYYGADWANMRSPSVPLLSDREELPGLKWIESLRNSSGHYPKYGFGSAHEGVVNAVFGDGSIRSISLSIELEVLQAISARADGEVVDVESL